MTAAQVPETEKIVVTDSHHGVDVAESYRWLEDWSNPKVKNWSDAQNRFARDRLDRLPHVDAITERVVEIMSDAAESYWATAYRGNRLFAMKRQPPKQQPFLVICTASLDEILVDPNVLDPEGTTSIDWFVPSPSGRWVAVSLSKAGTESGDVHFYDTKTGEPVFESIPRVNGGTAGGDLAWAAGEVGVFYTRYPRGTERPPEDMNFFQQLFYHRLGTATEDDRYELGKQLPRIAEIKVTADQTAERMLVTVQNGDGGEFAHFVRAPDGQWRQFTQFDDGHVQAAFGPRDDLYLVSRDGAPRGKILRLPISSLDVSNADVIVEESDDTIVTSFWSAPTVLPTADRLYVTYQLGGPSQVRVFTLDGRPMPGPDQLDVSSVGGLTTYRDNQILLQNGSFIEANAWYAFDPDEGTTTKSRLADKSSIGFDDYQVVREFAKSKDGTQVPLNIILPKSAKASEPRPCLVTGYGGYGINIEPRFSPIRRVALDQGMLYVVANLRGGGEYGRQWHRQGNLENKQNVFDDFTAVLEHLIRRGYTRSDQLVIEGGSNGGLLMGAVMTQHPDLMKAVVSHVGIYDMLRVELSPNGAFNIPEFGTVKDAGQFRAMHAYSPYHNVADGRAYPATMFLTGANDPRVDPMHSRKMTARLQAANSSDAPILLRTTDDAGHGGGTPLSERIAQQVDVLAFIFQQLGIEYEPK